MSGSFFSLLRSRFPADRTKEFIWGPDFEPLTYGDIDDLSARLAQRLVESGARRGERVMVQVHKSPLAVVLYLACLRGGLVFLPLNTAYRAEELQYLVSDAKPSVIVCDPDSVLRSLVGTEVGGPIVFTLDANGKGSLVEDLDMMPGQMPEAPMGGDELAAMLYTSGTTGRPKGAMLTQENLASNALALHAAWGFTKGDVLLHALPVYHTHGLFVAINTTLLNGGGMLFLRRFEPDAVVRLLPSATVMMGVPTYYTRLLATPTLDAAVCKSVRLFVSGSAPLLEETFGEFRERTGHTILERYGMTETNMITSNPLDGDRRAGSVGHPLPGVEVRIAGEDGKALDQGQIGSIQVRGPNVFKGYWGQPEKTASEFSRDGFFTTGDLGYQDPAGYLHIVGRSKDMIISGGLNIYPKEIESVLDEIDGVMETAVIGVAHPDFGEGVVAVVVRDEGRDRPVTDHAITGHAKKHLAGFKAPKAVFFIEELPRNAMGKVEKNKLREKFADTFASRKSASA